MLSRIVVALTLAAGLAPAQTQLKVNIPFDFVAADKQFPAGQYEVKSSSADPVVRIVAADHSSAMIALTNSVQGLHNSGSPKLVFHRYGNDYFLSQIWTGFGADGREMATSRKERELAKKLGGPERSTVMASSKSPK